MNRSSREALVTQETFLFDETTYYDDDGRIAEAGRHEELLARGGVYRRLYTLQFGPDFRDPAST